MKKPKLLELYHFLLFYVVPEVLAHVCSRLERPLATEQEPGLPQGIPKGQVVVVTVTTTAPAAQLGWKAELKTSRESDLKVHGEGLLILLLKALIIQDN